MDSIYLTHLKNEKTKFIEKCTLCGLCIRKCPVIPFSNLSLFKPKELQEKIIEYFESGRFCQEVIDFALVCANCKQCDLFCPVEDLLPGIRSEIIKADMYHVNQPLPDRANLFLPGEKYCAYDILSILQTKSKNIRWLNKIPARPKQTDNIFFLGCTGKIAPSTVFTGIDILSRLDIDFVTLDGNINFCCGGMHLFVGQIEKAEQLAKNFFKQLKKFKPKVVICWCPTCLSIITHKFFKYIPKSIKFQHFTSFLADHIQELRFQHPITKTVTIHDPCHLSRGMNEYQASRKVLSSIPGIRLVEMRHTKEESLCCGAAAGFFQSKVGYAMANQRINEVIESKADIVVTQCISCQIQLLLAEFVHGISTKFLPDVVGEALGISYEDKLKKLMALGSSKKIIEECTENIHDSGYTIEEMENILPEILGM